MGEKSGALTNMIITIVALVAVLLVVKVAFPDLTESMTEGMRNVIDTSIGEATGEIIDN